jgi:hypothetical protein
MDFTNGIRCIAYYLPQFHPTRENDQFWGKGFTEWTNVTKAKPLFRNHLQPFLPSDLGFYDLRIPEVREQQAALAKEAGIYGFCYWHYWFGNGKKTLERPLQDVMYTKKPDFPFCIAWANDTWSGRWHGLDDKIIFKQEYPGKKDYTDFFYDCLPMFEDSRYIKVNNKPLFKLYKPLDLPDIEMFLELWRNLALQHGFGGMYFVGIGDKSCISKGYDGFVSNGPVIPEKARYKTKFDSAFYLLFGKRLADKVRNFPHSGPQVFKYADVVEAILNEPLDTCEFPMVLPNWDNTPRSLRRGTVLQGSTPGLYGKYLEKALKLVTNKIPGEQIVFIKSWNEWAEGNVLEPSLDWGDAYLKETKEILESFVLFSGNN